MPTFAKNFITIWRQSLKDFSNSTNAVSAHFHTMLSRSLPKSVAMHKNCRYFEQRLVYNGRSQQTGQKVRNPA
jgi:hypothetical protein